VKPKHAPLPLSDAALAELDLLPVWRWRGGGEFEDAAQPAEANGVVSAASADFRSHVLEMDWPQLKACVKDCTRCVLHQKRTQSVFGVGDEKANWLFVGEGPGADEDVQGEPFVGQAGKLLDNMLKAIDLQRGNDVYIANVVKCRPPGNRNPEPDEARTCEPYLTRQIQLIQPKLIVALGKIAAVNLLARDVPVASLRNQVHEYQGIPLIVMYHPAYLLRNLPDKAKAWDDLLFARRTMAALQAKN
jgi:uracil-DNA glycosylase family 4